MPHYWKKITPNRMNPIAYALSYRKTAQPPIPLAVKDWPEIPMTSYAPLELLEISISKTLPMTKPEGPNWVFITRRALAAKPEANRVMATLDHTEDWSYDPQTQGYWVKQGSKTYTMAVMLGIDYHTGQELFVSGRWDRTGRIG